MAQANSDIEITSEDLPRREPGLSVILVAMIDFAGIRKTVNHLRAQTVAERIELVIGTPSLHNFGLDNSIEKDFLRVTVVETGRIPSKAYATAAAVRAATAPVVAFTEDHAFPDPAWAEALIDAHRQPWAAVGPEIRNGNAESMISWANFLPSYSGWYRVRPGVASDVPGHNSSYKRALLLEFGNDLTHMLEREGSMHRKLREKGQLYLEPRAKTNHVNVSVARYAISLRFNAGRLFAASRSHEWPFWKRLVYIAGSPLIPVLEMKRLIAEIYRIGEQHRLMPKVLPALTMVVVASAAGEVAGYLSGAGRALQTLWDFEVTRPRHITAREREELAI